MHQFICVWFQRRNGQPVWVVSLDTIDDAGHAESSKELCVRGRITDAYYRALAEAETRGLEVIDKNGNRLSSPSTNPPPNH